MRAPVSVGTATGRVLSPELEEHNVPSKEAHAPPAVFLPACSNVASAADGLQEPAREFGNSIWLAPPDGLSRDELSANAQRDCTHGNEAECCSLIPRPA